ncbi:MAG: replication-relaxation family protein [Anaerolineae bacterium]
MRLTERDTQVVLAVYEYRTLRREQIEKLFFPSRNTANERLQRLYQHGFLDRRWSPVEFGQGTSQAIYLLAEKGADLVAQQLGIDRGAVAWQASHNEVGSLFLEHTLMVNDVRIAVTQAASQAGYTVRTWLTEETLKATKDIVQVVTSGGAQRKIAVIADAYFVLNFGNKRAPFFLEVDRATEANKRWGLRVQAYNVYTESKRYSERYGMKSLRVLTVTIGPKRLANLKLTTEKAGGRQMFWFTTLEQIGTQELLSAAIWEVAGERSKQALIG